MFIISSCLLGDNCKYNGGNNYNERVFNFYENHVCFKVCPEVVGGLGIPRQPSEIVGERVLAKDEKDVTEFFQKGAMLAYEMARKEAEKRKENIEGAILKSKSPSCGSNQIYDGNFNGTIVNGDGYFAKFLKEKGITVITEKEKIPW